MGDSTSKRQQLLWPIAVLPLPDELFSSWLIRLIQRYQVKPETFTAKVLGRDVAVWNRDVDKSVKQSTIRHFSDNTGIPEEQLEATTLRSYETYLFERLNPNGDTSWILPAGIFHRVRTAFGLQYCPECLAEDAEPYFRKSWRIAAFTACPKHRSLLRDRCLSCESPVTLHRIYTGNLPKLTEPLINCFHCGADFREGGDSLSKANLKSLNFEACLLETLNNGYSTLEGIELPYSSILFDGLRQFIRIICSAQKKYDLLRENLGIEGSLTRFNKDIPPLTFERLPPKTRSEVMSGVSKLLSKWPENFIEIMESSKLSSAWILKDCKDPPFWLIQPIERYLSRKPYMVSQEERTYALNVVLRSGRSPSGNNINRMLGRRPKRNPYEERQLIRKRAISRDEIEIFFSSIDHTFAASTDPLERNRALRDKVLFVCMYGGRISIESAGKLTIGKAREIAGKNDSEVLGSWEITEAHRNLSKWIEFYISGPRKEMVRDEQSGAPLFVKNDGQAISSKGIRRRFQSYLEISDLHRRGITPRHFVPDEELKS